VVLCYFRRPVRMAVKDRTAQIQFGHYHYTKVPQTIATEIREDFYVLFTPLSSSKIQTMRDGKILFEGELRPGMLRLASPGESVEVSLKSRLRNIQLVIPGAIARRALRRAGYAWHAK